MRVNEKLDNELLTKIAEDIVLGVRESMQKYDKELSDPNALLNYTIYSLMLASARIISNSARVMTDEGAAQVCTDFIKDFKHIFTIMRNEDRPLQ